MKASLLRAWDELGRAGLAGLALLAAVAAFHLLVLRPMEAKSTELKARATREAPRAAQPAGTTVEQVAAVYEFLRKEEQPTDWLAKLHGIGSATGVKLKSATYRTQPAGAQIVRYEIVLPVAGSYPQIRDFLRRSAAEIPVLSIDHLALKRETRNDGELQAELRVTLHMVKS
jgi:Tfp pilus assembly protein PilO